MKENNLIVDKSKTFAIRAIRLYKYLCEEKKEYVMSKQLLKSGTSIGANVKEAARGQSKADFIAKLYIALKEANETHYWLELLYESEFIPKDKFESLYKETEELIALLTASIKTTQHKN